MSHGAPHGAAADVVEFDGRRGWSRRTWAVVLAVVSLLIGAAWLVEARTRARDQEAVATCAAVAEDALRGQDERFEFMADYLRPAMLALPVGGRDSLYALMSRTAAESSPRVRGALATCERVEPAWFHPDLRSRRDALVEHLAATVSLLRSIESDGRRYYQDTPELDAQRTELFAHAD